MLPQYRALQEVTNLRKSITRNARAVDAPQISKKKTFHVHLLVESFCIVFQKYIL